MGRGQEEALAQALAGRWPRAGVCVRVGGRAGPGVWGRGLGRVRRRGPGGGRRGARRERGDGSGRGPEAGLQAGPRLAGRRGGTRGQAGTLARNPARHHGGRRQLRSVRPSALLDAPSVFRPGASSGGSGFPGTVVREASPGRPDRAGVSAGGGHRGLEVEG